MRLGHDTKFALVVYQGAAEIIRVRKDRGPGHTLFMQRDILDFSEYDEHLDVLTRGPEDGSYVQVVHVVSVANRVDELPAPETLNLPAIHTIDAALPAIRNEIASARLSKQMKDYLGLLLADHNRATITRPFLEEAGGDGALALKLAVKKLTSWEASLFAGIEARVKDTLAGDEPGRPRGADDFVERVRGAARAAQEPKADRIQPAAPVAEDSPVQCRADLQKLLAETMEKIGEIDRRLLACGPAPAWRDSMNEVFYAAMQVSRTLDYAPDDEPRPAPRRHR
jgi:hypothetical protein